MGGGTAIDGGIFRRSGAREDGQRTVFAVGDIKQSIFGFQRADPTQFPEMRERFATAVPMVGARWEPVTLDTSFRSTPAVLRAVDLVFAQDVAKDGVAEGSEPIEHRAAREGSAGIVELWPPVEPRLVEETPAWLPPTTRIPGDDPEMRLAKLIGLRIRAMLDGERIEAHGQPVKPGDILVFGATAYALRRCAGAVAESARRARGRFRPHDPDRATGGDGSTGAGQCAVAA